MANSFLIELGINDSLADVVRKCNNNFKRISSDQSRIAKQSVRQEASRTDEALKSEADRIDKALAGAIGEINQAIANGLKTIDDKVSEIEFDSLWRYI